jgi:hypothetical protein
VLEAEREYEKWIISSQTVEYILSTVCFHLCNTEINFLVLSEGKKRAFFQVRIYHSEGDVVVHSPRNRFQCCSRSSGEWTIHFIQDQGRNKIIKLEEFRVLPVDGAERPKAGDED